MRAKSRPAQSFGEKALVFLSAVFVAGAAAALFWMLNGAGTAYACSCAPPGRPAEELRTHSAVFSGQVVAVRHSFEPGQPALTPDDRTTVEFQVASVWKGALGHEIQITTPSTGGSCGVPFVEGEDYLVYAHDSPYEEGGYAANICSRTKSLAEAAEDLEDLGEGNRSGSPAPDPENSLLKDPFLVALIALIAAAAAAGGIFFYRRKTGT